MNESNITGSTSDTTAYNVRKPFFAKGYFGVFGPAASAHNPRVPGSFGESATAVLQTKCARIFAFGNTTATLQLRKQMPAFAIFDGRPFLLNEPLSTDCVDWDSTSWVEHFLTQLDGKFSCCIRNRNSKFTLATDLLGTGSLFYRETKDSIFFASHLGVLLCNLPDIPDFDFLGIAALVCSSTGFRGRTPYEGIHRLESCEYLAITARNGDRAAVSRRTYTSFHDAIFCGSPADARDIDDYVDELTDLMRASVKRENYPDHFVLMLSGGRDSRAIACVLSEFSNGPRIEAVTYGHPSSQEMIRARQVARQLRLKHHAVPYSAWDLSTYSQRITETNGGVSGLQTNHILVGYDYARTVTDLAPVGFLGDALSGAHLPKNESGSFRNVEKSILWGAQDGHSLASVEFRKELAILRDELRCEYNSLGFLPPYQRHLFLDLITRQAGWISASFDIAESFLEISYPFYHQSLFRFWFNLPLPLLQRQHLYDLWLARSYSMATKQSGGVASEFALWANRQVMRFQNRFSRPKKAVDWQQTLMQSRGWCFNTINACCHDDRLKRFSLACLDEASDGTRNRPNPLVFALAPCIARKHATT